MNYFIVCFYLGAKDASCFLVVFFFKSKLNSFEQFSIGLKQNVFAYTQKCDVV